MLVYLMLLVAGCDDFTPTPVNFSQEDIVEFNSLHTLEINEHILASLPSTPPLVDDTQAELGRILFWDPILSGDQDVACATCHLPEAGYTDRQTQSIGVGGMGRAENRTVGHTGRVPRNAQTVLNTVWNGIDESGVFNTTTAPMFWDNRTESLESQALEPLRSRKEMRGDNFTVDTIESVIVARLNNNPAYRLAFNDAFETETIEINHVTSALAAFQRTLIANNSPFDLWMRGVPEAMTNRQISGMQEFVLAGCADCHSGPLFSDFENHVLGIQEGADVEESDDGDGKFAFRTPTLRQLAFTEPYFHAGQFPSLSEAINFYDEPRNSRNPAVASSELDIELVDIPEIEGGRGALIQEFLNALNDDSFDKSAPDSVHSGLIPGGFNSNNP